MPHLAIDYEPAALHVDSNEAAISLSAKQQPIARVITAQERRHTVQVPADDQVRLAVAVEISGHSRVNRCELRLRRQWPKCERAVAVVQRDGAREIVRLQHLRLGQLLAWEDVLDAARAKRFVGRELLLQRRHRLNQLISAGDGIARPVSIRRENLLNGSRGKEFTNVQSRRLPGRRTDIGVQSQVAEHQVVLTIAIGIQH